MKLKLEVESGITVLCVTEDVLNQHGPILKAGITKLFQSGKKSILLDLTGISQMDEGVVKDLTTLQAVAVEMDAHLVIASALQGVGQAPTRTDAIKYMASPLFGLLATEAHLQARLKKFEQQKNELTEKLNSVKSGEVDPLVLRKENSDLKTIIHSLEAHILTLLKVRNEPKAIPVLSDKQRDLEKTLSLILGQDGILTVKT